MPSNEMPSIRSECRSDTGRGVPVVGKALERSEGDGHLPWGVWAAQGMAVWVERRAALR